MLRRPLLLAFLLVLSTVLLAAPAIAQSTEPGEDTWQTIERLRREIINLEAQLRGAERQAAAARSRNDVVETITADRRAGRLRPQIEDLKDQLEKAQSGKPATQPQPTAEPEPEQGVLGAAVEIVSDLSEAVAARLHRDWLRVQYQIMEEKARRGANESAEDKKAREELKAKLAEAEKRYAEATGQPAPEPNPAAASTPPRPSSPPAGQAPGQPAPATETPGPPAEEPSAGEQVPPPSGDGDGDGNGAEQNQTSQMQADPGSRPDGTTTEQPGPADGRRIFTPGIGGPPVLPGGEASPLPPTGGTTTAPEPKGVGGLGTGCAGMEKISFMCGKGEPDQPVTTWLDPQLTVPGPVAAPLTPAVVVRAAPEAELKPLFGDLGLPMGETTITTEPGTEANEPECLDPRDCPAPVPAPVQTDPVVPGEFTPPSPAAPAASEEEAAEEPLLAPACLEAGPC